MNGKRWCWSVALLIGATATAALAAPDGVPIKPLSSFQPFRLSLASPGYEIKPPSGATKYLEMVQFEEPARVSPIFNAVDMRYDPKSAVHITVGPDQANKLLAHSWDFTCRVRNAGKLVVRRSVSGPANPATTITLEAAVVNDTATFTVPNYQASSNDIYISTKLEYKTGNFFAWSFEWCDVKPVSKLKIVPPFTPKP